MSKATESSAVDDEVLEDDDQFAAEEASGDEETGDEETGDGSVRSGGRTRRPSKARVELLEQEGEIAADYLEGLLDIADLDGDIDMDVEGDRAAVSIVGADLKQLIGKDGAVLDAVQELTRLAVLRATGERSRLMLDIGGFRAARRAELTELGAKSAQQAKESGEPVRLAPMTPFERKVVHDAVAEAGLRSESDGEEPNRRVVVYPS
ncbi:MAG TPA: R3H domain-containing nucleic acid-binding protein [Sporichthyaceae bacterium]